MKTFPLFAALLFAPALLFAQRTQDTIVNPKGSFYFGIETGLNTITSYSFDEPANSIQAGLTAEYYFAKHWSITGRLKYFKTGITFEQESYINRFEGNVLAVPLNLKWEFSIYKNLRGYLKAGGTFNFETGSNYDFAPGTKKDNSKFFGSLNTGLGLTYFLSDKIAVYADLEQFTSGGDKGFHSTDSFDIGIVSDTYTTNRMVNIGVKYKF